MATDTEIEVIYPGDSTDPWLIVRWDSMRKPMVVSDHACHVKVEGTTIDRPITSLQMDQKAFIGGLAPSETAQFVHGEIYKAIVTLSKAAEPWKKTALVYLQADNNGVHFV